MNFSKGFYSISCYFKQIVSVLYRATSVVIDKILSDILFRNSFEKVATQPIDHNHSTYHNTSLLGNKLKVILLIFVYSFSTVIYSEKGLLMKFSCNVSIEKSQNKISCHISTFQRITTEIKFKNEP